MRGKSDINAPSMKARSARTAVAGTMVKFAEAVLQRAFREKSKFECKQQLPWYTERKRFKFHYRDALVIGGMGSTDFTAGHKVQLDFRVDDIYEALEQIGNPPLDYLDGLLEMRRWYDNYCVIGCKVTVYHPGYAIITGNGEQINLFHSVYMKSHARAGEVKATLRDVFNCQRKVPSIVGGAYVKNFYKNSDTYSVHNVETLRKYGYLEGMKRNADAKGPTITDNDKKVNCLYLTYVPVGTTHTSLEYPFQPKSTIVTLEWDVIAFNRRSQKRADPAVSLLSKTYLSRTRTYTADTNNIEFHSTPKPAASLDGSMIVDIN